MTDNKNRFTNGSKKHASRSDSDNLLTSQKEKGFFLDDEDDDDIVAKIHHWKRTGSAKDSKAKPPQKRREVRDLFSEPVEKEDPQHESDDTVPSPNNDIQLNRLLDDYMLGEKGDRIMQQMEELAMEDKPLTDRDTKSPSEDLFRDDTKSAPEKQEPSLDLDAMLSMKDFEKYISDN